MAADEPNVVERRAGECEQAVTNWNLDLSDDRDGGTACIECLESGRHWSDRRIRDRNDGPLDSATSQFVERFVERAGRNCPCATVPCAAHSFLAIRAGDPLIRGSERGEIGLVVQCANRFVVHVHGWFFSVTAQKKPPRVSREHLKAYAVDQLHSRAPAAPEGGGRKEAAKKDVASAKDDRHVSQD
jgi:hypothetical protein